MNVNRNLIIKSSPPAKKVRKVQDLIALGTTVGGRKSNFDINKTFDSRGERGESEALTPIIAALDITKTPNMTPKSSLKEIKQSLNQSLQSPSTQRHNLMSF